jgi:hypothetical protein
VTFGAVEQAYIAAREAGVPAGLIRESEGISPDCRLYLLPSTKQLTGPGWRRLEELARSGATVYTSYCAGGGVDQRGPWYAGVDRLFGVRHRLRYGLVDRVAAETVVLTVEREFGGLRPGARLEFVTGSNPHVRGYLPVEPVDAEVLATDQDGRPALVRRSVGTGAMVLCTYPVEAMAAATPEVNPEQSWRLYAALAAEAGVTPPVRVGDPRVLVDCLDRDDGARFVWLVSQSPEPLTVTPEPTLSDVDTGVAVTSVALPPYGVRVLRAAEPYSPGA